MKCGSCGQNLPADVLLCPHCGALHQSTRPAAALVQERAVYPAHAAQPRVRTGARRRIVLVLLIGLSCALVLMLGGSGLAGYFVGINDRETQRAQEADRFFRKGLDDMAAGHLELAEADFALVLSINLDYPGAAEQLQLTRQMIVDLQRIEPTATTSIHDAVTGLFVTARQAYNDGDWATAVAQLTQIKRIAPDYEPDAVEQLLFTASYTYGLELLEEDRLEEGVFHLEQAAKLRPLDQDAVQQAEYAKMYLTASGYWNVNWDLAIERFGELVAVAPNYKDAYARYVEAYVVYADSYADNGDYCPAQPLYQQAIALRPDDSVQRKIDSAVTGCLSATPVPITGTIPISGTPVAVPGVNVGRLAYPIEDPATGATTIYAISPGGSPFVAAFGGQPTWQPNGSALAYRVLGVGISVIDLATGNARSIAPAGAAWPSWSPDGNRLAYAQRDTTGEFRLTIATLDGSAQPIDIGAGESPVWSPLGTLAFKGCDGSGCGIMVDDPNDLGPPVRLTSSPQDIPTSWSPDGFNIAYFSNADGDWDIYFVNTAGGVAQVVNAPGNDGLPTWSPDGAHLAFASDRDGSWAIYIVRFDGTELIKAIELGPSFGNWNNERLAWAP